MEKVFRSIKEVADNQEPGAARNMSGEFPAIDRKSAFLFFPFILVGPGLGALTADYRDAWAKNREHLRSLSEKNKAYLEDIETAMAIVVLDQDAPTSTTDCCRKLMVGDTKNRF